MSIFHSIKNLQRFEHILNALFKYELGYIIHKLDLKHHLPLHKRLQRHKFEKRDDNPEKLRLVFEELGGAFVKLAQLLSVRPDLIPLDYVKELEKLLDRVEPIPFEDIEKQIEKEFKKPLKEIFPYFKKQPIASASIAQVHEARLKNGQRVAVKVQKPKVRELMEEDISIMYFLANLLEKHIPKFRHHSPVTIVKEFDTWTRNELDFEVEAKYAKRFYYNFKGSKTVKIPRVYDELTTKEVLTLEFIDGIELHDIEKVKKRCPNLKKLIKNGFDAVLTQIFIHGFFHADPHPGNIIIGRGGVISFVDFGIVGYFDNELKRKAIEIFRGIINSDADKIVAVFTEMGMSTGDDIHRFKMDLEDLIRPLQDSSLKNVKISYVLEDVFELAHKHRVRLTADFALFGKTIVELEGLALRYHPDFKVTRYIKPFLRKLKRYELEKTKKDIISTGWEYKDLIKTLPEKASKLFKRFETGSVKIDIEDKDVRNLTVEIDKSSNRLTYGVIIASLVIGSALISYIGRGPMLYEISVFSVMGFVMAIVLGIILMVSIIRERKR